MTHEMVPVLPETLRYFQRADRERRELAMALVRLGRSDIVQEIEAKEKVTDG